MVGGDLVGWTDGVVHDEAFLLPASSCRKGGDGHHIGQVLAGAVFTLKALDHVAAAERHAFDADEREILLELIQHGFVRARLPVVVGQLAFGLGGLEQLQGYGRHVLLGEAVVGLLDLGVDPPASAGARRNR